MNKRRLFAVVLALIMTFSCFCLSASAEANPPSDDVVIWTSEPTEPQETRPAETTPPATEPAPTIISSPTVIPLARTDWLPINTRAPTLQSPFTIVPVEMWH